MCLKGLKPSPETTIIPYVEEYGEQTIDIHVFNTCLNDILNESDDSILELRD